MVVGGTKLVRVATMLGALLPLASGEVAAQANQLRNEVAASGGRVIVMLRQPEGAAMRAQGAPAFTEAEVENAVSRIRSRRQITVRGSAPKVGAVFAEVSPDEAGQLASDPDVLLVEADRPWPLMETVDEPPPAGRLADVVPWGVTKVTAPEVWSTFNNRGQGIKVGVLDSGGDYDHPDLRWAGGYDAVTKSTSASAWDDNVGKCNGHGTHVAGTIAALENGLGVVGVAPAVDLYAIKVFEIIDGNCAAWTSTQITGLNWAVSQGIRLVNASVGGSYSGAYDAAITAAAQAGTYLIGAAGNNGNYVMFPGAAQYAIAVGGLTSSDTRGSYSNTGPEIDFSAPGSSITSTMPGGGTGSKSGTSMATPHVTGVAALILASNPSLTFSGLYQKLKDGALDLGTAGFDNSTGWGRVRALNSIQGGGSAPPPPPPVPLAMSVSPASRYVGVQQGSAAAGTNATVTLTGDGASTRSWSAAKKKSWTTLVTASGTGNGSVAWSRNTAGLTPGVYVDTITVTASGANGSPAQVIDSLVITAAPVPLAMSVSPASRYLSVQQGTAAAGSSASVTLTGDGASTRSWSAAKKKNWTTLTSASGTGSGTVAWTRNTAGLTPGVYVDTITVTASGANGSPARVIDTLVITAIPVPLAISVSPSSRSVSAQQGTAAAGGNASVTITGDGAASTSWTATKRKSWTTLTTASGTGSGTVAWTRNTAGLTPGVYVDTITVTASGANGSPARVIDTLVITAIPVPLAISVSPSSRNVSAQQGTSAPSGEASVSLTGDGAASTSWTATKRKNWTTLTTASGTGSGTVAWTRNTAGLTPGVYVDTITVTASGANGSPARVIDTLVITAIPVPLAISVSPSSRNVSAQQGTAAAGGNASVTITGDGAASTSWTATKRKNWTTLTTASGTGSGTVAWTRNTAGLTPGVYVDTITVTASGANGSPARVIDTLVITAIPVPLAISVSPSSRNVSAQQGTAAAGGNASVTITGDGAASTSWTAAKRKSWTTLTSASGTGSGTIAWTRNTAGLTPGVYVDTITVAATGANGSPARVIDTLVITAPPVPLAISVAPTSRRKDILQGADAGADSAYVSVTGDGASSRWWSAGKRKDWNTLTRASGQGSGMVRWSRSSAGLAPGVHIDTIIVTMAGASGSPTVVIDSLVITALPVPLAISVSPSSRSVSVQQGNPAPGSSASITLTGDGASTATWTASRRQAWTSLGSSTGVGSGTVEWSRNTAGMVPGIYVDTITVTANGANGSPARVIDTLVITAAPVPLAMTVSPASRTVTVQQGGVAPIANAEISFSGNGAASAQWSADKRKPWTTLATPSGTGNGFVSWTRSTAGLAPGVYVDTISIASPGATGSPGRVIDTLVITAAPVPLALSVSPTSRRVNITEGSNAAAASATVSITGDGASTASWTAANGRSWTVLTVSSGNGSGTVSWARNVSGLPVGTHVDTITVVVNGTTLQARVIDSIVVAAPNPVAPTPAAQVKLAKAGKRNSVSRMAGQAIDDGVDSVLVEQAQTVAGVGQWVAVSSGSWLRVATTNGSGPGQLRFSRSYNLVAAGTHVDTITVSLVGSPDVKAIYVDTLQVADVQPPTPAIAVRDLFNGSGLNSQQRNAFDLLGNRNGRFDLGDFLAWVRGAGVRLSPSEMAEVQAVMEREAAEVAGGHHARDNR